MYMMWELRRRGAGGESSSSSNTAATAAATTNGSPSNNGETQNNNDASLDLRLSNHRYRQHHQPPAPPPSSSEKKRSLRHHHSHRPHFLPIRRLYQQAADPRRTGLRAAALLLVAALVVGGLWRWHSGSDPRQSPHDLRYSRTATGTSSSSGSQNHRVAAFQYEDESDRRRTAGLAKIRKFQREWNVTDLLPPNAMATPKFFKRLGDSRDYAQLGEPVETDECEAQYEWQRSVNPTCNTLHEFADLTQLSEGTGTVVTKLIANGFWRDVWVVTDDHGVRVVKTLRYKHKLNLRNYDRNRRDAVALEHLTSSKYVVDIYGYCSAAGLFEYSNGGDIANAIWPSGTTPTLTPLRKLHIAAQGAMALAAVHNFDSEGRASIAHTDIGPDQFILVGGRYKLNDFNRCRFLLKYKHNNTNCPYFVNKNPGKNRSPEEYQYKPQSEKVDVYSFGNILYSLLQEELPFQDQRMKDVPDLVIKGVRPSIYYDVWNSTDPIIQSLKEAMIRCHEGDPDDRATAREVEVFLKSKLEEFDPGRLQEWGDS